MLSTHSLQKIVTPGRRRTEADLGSGSKGCSAPVPQRSPVRTQALVRKRQPVEPPYHLPAPLHGKPRSRIVQGRRNQGPTGALWHPRRFDVQVSSLAREVGLEPTPHRLEDDRSRPLSYPRVIGCDAGNQTQGLSLRRGALCSLSYAAKNAIWAAS